MDKIKKLITELKNSELYELKNFIEKEILLSETVISQGFEKRK
jgi:hypothetical protein